MVGFAWRLAFLDAEEKIFILHLAREIAMFDFDVLEEQFVDREARFWQKSKAANEQKNLSTDGHTVDGRNTAPVHK